MGRFKGNTLSHRRFRRLIVSHKIARWWERGSESRLYPRPLIKSFAPLILVGFTTANENFRREIKKCWGEKLIVRDWSVSRVNRTIVVCFVSKNVTDHIRSNNLKFIIRWKIVKFWNWLISKNIFARICMSGTITKMSIPWLFCVNIYSSLVRQKEIENCKFRCKLFLIRIVNKCCHVVSLINVIFHFFSKNKILKIFWY